MLTPEQWQEAQKLPANKNWRLIDTGKLPGALNMGIDEAILQAAQAGSVPPTLRVYGWQPAAISLGYFQHGTKEIDFAACQEAGIDVVRRLTGGRAVLHSSELTYSLIVSENYPGIPLAITASYLYLSQGLLKGMQHLGLKAALTVPQGAYAQRRKIISSAACFDAPSYYELTVAGKKLIGSAQVRKNGFILQHGSILLAADPGEIVPLLKLGALEKNALERLLRNHATNIQTALGRSVTYEEVKAAVVRGFMEALEIDLKPKKLLPQEMAKAEVLAKNTYQNQAWTKKR